MDDFLKELAALLEKHDVTIRGLWCHDEASIEIEVGPIESIEFDYNFIDADAIREKYYTTC